MHSTSWLCEFPSKKGISSLNTAESVGCKSHTLVEMLSVVLFPNAYHQAREMVSTSQPFQVTGTIEMDASKEAPVLRAERASSLGA